MREFDYDEWLARPRASARLIAELAEREAPRRRKPRDPLQTALLARMAVSKMRRREAEGRLVRIGPRTYELRTTAEVLEERR